MARIVMYTALTICACNITATFCKPADPELLMLEKEKIRMEIRSYELAERELYNTNYSDEYLK